MPASSLPSPGPRWRSATQGGGAVLVLVSAGLLAKLAREERLLAALFPDDYATYRRRTKKLLPYIW
jgi:protein-S-isoprenylcysteine O-methyltransferase Ste14